jgi:hypothetical protein
VGGTGEVEDDEGDESVLEVAGDQRAEAFLAGGVPELHAEDAGADVQVLGHEVDADGGLDERWGTPMPSSNLSWMNRMRMEVLPVDCSPRKTTLILLFTCAKDDSDFFSCI